MKLTPEVRAALTAAGVPLPPAKRASKYNAKSTVVGGLRFDSRREAKRWGELLMMQRAGLITDLDRQVSFPLVVNGVLVTTYRADFAYVESGVRVIEDSKGVRTREYVIKAKLMLALHKITIRET